MPCRGSQTLSPGTLSALGCEPGLKALCWEYLSLHLDKTYQCSDWRLRPLPLPMLAYAARDSRVLLPLATCMVAHLLAAGRLDSCRAACERLLSSATQAKQAAGRLYLDLL
eukprot:TRINITY_DN38356_c0_g1_i1.p2 TRINITY_DN38356_c0_g1~~TRINITY_DN38356_c0_g1_i1.p2  ORF type:complete len:123 (+),score=15.86 TRINITY_DN38356_c0_g1_i1:39-371(+)